MIKFLTSFQKDESGAAMVEYGLLVALIAAVVVVVVGALGTQIKAGFCDVETAINTAGVGTGSATGCAAAPAA